MGYPVEPIPLPDITADEGIQARTGLDEAAADRYAEVLAAGQTLPPGVVYRDADGVNWLAGGFHRLAAHARQDRESFSCEVRPGTRRDALKYACGDNTTHGLPRTREDARRAVKLLLADEECGKLSTTQIAETAKVSWSFADKVRTELEAAAGGTPATRESADGRQMPARSTARAGGGSVERPGGDGESSPDSVPSASPPEDDPDPPPPRAMVDEPTTQPTAEDFAEMKPAVVVTDALGVPVPDDLVPVFEDAGQMKAIGRAIAGVLRDLEELRGEPGAKKLAINNVATLLENAKATIAAATPLVVCPACDGAGGTAGEPCQVCGPDTPGWLWAARYGGLPNALRKRAERFKKTVA